MTRDFDANPYSPDEARVAKWIADLTGAGGGDDPIGFLIASHELMAMQRTNLRQHFIRSRLSLGFEPVEAREHLDEVENGV
jgi:hypothetical protein